MKPDGQYTQNEDETNAYLLDKFFPQDDQEENTPERQQIRRDRHPYIEAEEYDIVAEEVRGVIRAVKKRKAAAADKIPNEAMTHIFGVLGDELLQLYRECWRKGIFPACWKKAKVIWLPKKDGSPRPISLLPTLGKVLDRVVNSRLQLLLEKEGTVSDEQFGYRKGRGTTDALVRFNDEMRKNRGQKGHQLMIALDLANAFNRAWGPYVARQLKRCGVGPMLGKVCESFLEGRSVMVGNVERRTTKGCPHGSSLGPTLWNVVMEGWFAHMRRTSEAWSRQHHEEGQRVLAHYQAYADDQVVVIAGSSLAEIERKWRAVWEACEQWQMESNTSYNIGKTESMFVTKDGKRIREPLIKMGNGEREVTIYARENMRYLGVIFDRVGNFCEHGKMVRKKTTETTNRLLNLVKKTYGRNGEFMKTLVDRVIIPAVLYGAEVWGNKANGSFNSRTLEAAQRPFLLAIARRYRTTPTAALQVLSGTPPWGILALVKYEEFSRNRREIDKAKVVQRRCLEPALRAQMAGVMGCLNRNARLMHVDAGTSRCNGYGIVEQEESTGANLRIWQYCSEVLTDTHLAEKLAVLIAVGRVREAQCDVVICTDRRGIVDILGARQMKDNVEVLIWEIIAYRWSRGWRTILRWVSRNAESMRMAHRAATRAARMEGERLEVEEVTAMSKINRRKERKAWALELWQEAWRTGAKGRSLFELCGSVGLDRLNCSFKAIQLATGHGNFNAYLRRFRLAETDGGCQCGQGSEDVGHIRRDCTTEKRRRVRDRIVEKYRDLEINLREVAMTVQEQVEKLNEWAKEAVEDDGFVGGVESGSDQEE